MAETLTLEGTLGQHWLGVDPRTHESTCTCGWRGPVRMGDPLGRQGDQKAHLADAVRAWLLGQEIRVLAITNAQLRLAEMDCPSPQRWGREAAAAVLGALTGGAR